MKVKKITREEIHKYVSSKFARRDGEMIMWLFGRAKEDQGNCIYAVCGNKDEVMAWVNQLQKEQGILTKEEYLKKAAEAKEKSESGSSEN